MRISTGALSDLTLSGSVTIDTDTGDIADSNGTLVSGAASGVSVFVQPAGGASGDRARGNRLSVRFGVRSRPVEGGEGLEVVSATDGSSAADARIVAGAVVLLVGKGAVGSRGDLGAKLRAKNPGDVMSVTILRDAEEQLLYVTLKGAE